MKIELNLSEEELETVKTALERYVSDLSVEIADTDSMEFRENLKSERHSLQKVIDQLVIKKD